MIEDGVISLNNSVVKLAYIKCSELSHAAKAFEKCDPTYRPKYRSYYHGSRSPEEEETKKEQEGAPVMLLTNYIRPADKRQPGDKRCIRFNSKKCHGIMEKLQFVPMSLNCHPRTSLYHLKIWTGFVTTVHQYKDKIMLCPNVACGILKINANLDTLNDTLNMDDVIVLLDDGHNTCRLLITPRS